MASSTINLRLAVDTCLVSPELAAGIRRVKEAKELGLRLGNWLSADQAKALLDSAGVQTVRGKRSRAILAVYLGCGLRRSELHILRWRACNDGRITGHYRPLIGKGGYI